MLGEGRHRSLRKIALPTVAEAVSQSLELLESLPRQALPSGWGRIFVDQQKIWNWPGDTPLDSALHQTLNAWQELISQFARLDASVGELTLQQARSLIQRLARQRRFQPLNSDAGVQILATLEPWPGQFDAIRVVGLDDQQFPASASANPFLPLALQRRLEMPGASPEQAQGDARRQLAAWGIAGDQLSVSFAQTSHQGDHRGSPLIDWSDLKPEAALVVAPAQRLFAAAQQAPLVETYTDSTGLPVMVGPEGPARVGAGLFQDQAECPFKAYLKRRLLTTVPEEPLPGLDALAQGSLVHQVLEQFWQAVGSSEALQQLDNAQRDQQITLAINTVIEGAAQQPGLDSEFAQQLERGRLTMLVSHWLPRELERQPFTVVGFEQPLELQVGDLLVNGRADRIDQLDDGRQVVIDYKSGEVKRKQWFSEPLIAPQLPLYQLAIDDPAGVAFAQLKPGKQKFVDVGEGGFKPGGHPKDPDWQVIRRQWQEALTGLAADYLAGNAAVAPAEPGVCNYCEFELICRVGEGDLAWQQEDAE